MPFVFGLLVDLDIDTTFTFHRHGHTRCVNTGLMHCHGLGALQESKTE